MCSHLYTPWYGAHKPRWKVFLYAPAASQHNHPSPMGFSLCTLPFLVLHEVMFKYSAGTAKHHYNSLFSWKSFSWVKKTFFLVSKQLLRCNLIQTTSMHADSPTTADTLQLPVQYNGTEIKRRSLQIFAIHNYQKVGMKHSKVPVSSVLMSRSYFEKTDHT